MLKPNPAIRSDDFAVAFAKRHIDGEALRRLLIPLTQSCGWNVEVHPSRRFACVGATLSRELDTWCLAKGFSLDTDNDWEIAGVSQGILREFRARGNIGVGNLEGQFCAAIYHEGTLSLHRDRFGFGSLYVWERAEAWVIASNLRVLGNLADWPPRLSELGLEVYLTYGRLPGASTLFEGVTQVPSAGYVLLPSGLFELQWNPDFQEHPDRSEAEALEFAERRLASFLDLLPPGDSELLFSGGVDSTLLLAIWAKAMVGDPVNLHTLVYGGKKKVDAALVQPLAEQYRASLKLTALDSDLTGGIDILARALQQPDASSGLLSSLALYEHATRNTCVHGVGGDAVFANSSVPERVARSRRWSWVSQSLLGALRGIVGPRHLALSIMLEDPWSMVIASMPYRPKAARRRLLLSRDPACADQADRLFEPIVRLLPEDAPLARRFQFLLLMGRHCPRSQAIADVATRFGRRCVCPYLDRRLFEYQLGLPDAVRSKNWEKKYLLEELLRRLNVPRERVKSQSLQNPLETHLRRKIHGVEEELLGSTSRLSEYLNAREIRRCLVQHRLGRNRTKVIWPLLLLSRWLRSQSA